MDLSCYISVIVVLVIKNIYYIYNTNILIIIKKKNSRNPFELDLFLLLCVCLFGSIKTTDELLM